MASFKPPWFTVKLFNKLAMATEHLSGTETLTLTARSSGRRRKIPVITVDVDGSRCSCGPPAASLAVGRGLCAPTPAST